MTVRGLTSPAQQDLLRFESGTHHYTLEFSDNSTTVVVDDGLGITIECPQSNPGLHEAMSVLDTGLYTYPE